MSYEELLQKLQPYGQEHLLKFHEKLSDEEKIDYFNDVKSLDIEEVDEVFQRANNTLEMISSKLDDVLEPIPATSYESVPSLPREKLEEYENIGFEEISLGRVGVLLLAGGQGTRLGFEYPKGMYNVGLPSHKTLFQIQAERILRLQQLAKEKTGKSCLITWYIMTSVHTTDHTKNFFAKQKFFGLNKENIIFFEQGCLPCFNFDGKLLLDEINHISTAPDGNGGLYKALRVSKILDDFDKRGIKHLHAHSLDNILIKVADPVFIGYCKAKNSDCAAKVVQKSTPSEAVGVVCRVDGKYRVVEYSEITLKTAELKNEDGSLKFKAGNICNHYFSAEFLKKVSNYDSKLKLHVAKKKIPYIDDNGLKQKLLQPNGIKIEKFIFDVFEFAENFVTLEVAREVEFSALKNSDDAQKDCPSTARQDLFNLHRIYVRNAGGIVDDDVEIEISPLLSYAGENINERVENVVFKNGPYHLKSPDEELNSNGIANGAL